MENLVRGRCLRHLWYHMGPWCIRKGIGICIKPYARFMGTCNAYILPYSCIWFPLMLLIFSLGICAIWWQIWMVSIASWTWQRWKGDVSCIPQCYSCVFTLGFSTLLADDVLADVVLNIYVGWLLSIGIYSILSSYQSVLFADFFYSISKIPEWCPLPPERDRDGREMFPAVLNATLVFLPWVLASCWLMLW